MLKDNNILKDKNIGLLIIWTDNEYFYNLYNEYVYNFKFKYIIYIINI